LCNKKECIKSSIKKQIKVISSYGVELRKQNIPISQTLEIYCSAVADSSYIETDDAQGGTNIVLDVADQPVKHQNKMLQFTMPSGLHSVLERPFSEANGRPFLVKRSPLIVC